MAFPPLHATVRTLWAPQVLYEPHNPRQRAPLDLYARDPSSSSIISHGSSNSSNRETARQKRDAHAKYAYRRDLTNVLRGTSTRMVWDYQAEAVTLSDEEQEYEAQLEAVRNHGYGSLVPEGKAMNQEAEAEDEAINEEARATAAAAQAQAQRDANAAAQAELDAVDDTVEVAASRRQARRQGRREQGENRRSGRSSRDSGAGITRSASTGGGQVGAGGRTSSTTGGGRAPASRESAIGRAARAPPRASGRYSISSSGGGSSSAAFPRYGGPMQQATAAAGNTSADSGAGGRDLDSEIPEAEEASYNDASQNNADEQPDLDGDLTDLDELDDDEGGRSENQEPYSPRSPEFSEGDENAENGPRDDDSTDMDVSS